MICLLLTGNSFSIYHHCASLVYRWQYLKLLTVLQHTDWKCSAKSVNKEVEVLTPKHWLVWKLNTVSSPFSEGDIFTSIKYNICFKNSYSLNVIEIDLCMK